MCTDIKEPTYVKEEEVRRGDNLILNLNFFELAVARATCFMSVFRPLGRASSGGADDVTSWSDGKSFFPPFCPFHRHQFIDNR